MNLIKLPRIRVQDKEGQYDETLTCIQRDGSSKSIEMNQSDQIDFTATNDGSTGYQLLQNENYLIFNDQKYRIKQAERDDEAHDLKKTVSATHIWFDVQYIHQYDKLDGDHQVNANDLMSFVFDQNDLGNNGFTWEVIGNTDKVTVSDYGDISGLDCVNDCISKFNLVVVADNKHIKLLPMDKWQHKTNKTFRYIHDTPTFKASVDTTELQNITKVFGKSGKPSSSSIGTAIGTINTMESGGAPVYSDPDNPTNEVQRLPNGTKWVMDSKASAGDATWYRVSTNGWVNEKYITFEKDGDVSPESHIITKVKGQGTIKASESTDTDNSDNTDTSVGNAVGTINTIDFNGAPVYSTPGDTTVARYITNGSKLAVSNKKKVGDINYYQVATNEWVSEKYITFDKDGDVKPEEHLIKNVSGKGTIKSDKAVDIYNSPFTPQDKTGGTVANGTQWMIDAEVSNGAQNKSWYRIGTNQWITQDSFEFTGDTDVSPSEDTTGSDEVKIYDSPFTPQTLVQNTLKNGTRWYIDAQVSEGAQGKTWYRVATNQWVNSEDFDFSGDEDVEPKEEKTDDDDTASEDDHSTDYFAPFYVRDEKSIAEWGKRPGPSITNDTIKDPNEMKKYALSQMKTEPEVSISLTYSGSDDFNIGDMVYCDIQPEKFTTWVTVVNVKYNPFSYVKEYELSLNSTPQTLADYELSIQGSLMNASKNAAISLSNGSITNPWLTTKVGEV